MTDITQPTLPGSYERRLPLLAFKLGQTVLTLAEGGLAELGLTGRQYSLLTVLGEERPQSQQELGRIVGLVPPVVVAAVDELERRDLAVRRRSDEDRRRIVVELTPAGRELLDRADAYAQTVEDQIFAPLSADEREQLHEAMARVMRVAWGPCWD